MKEIDIGLEKNLESIVIKSPDSIEDGLKVLTHQRRANGKFIDVLCVDRDGVLVVVELKINQEDEMLFQAIEYYDYVSTNRDRIASEYDSKFKIVKEEDPRIILVAPVFSERLKKAVRYFNVKIDLKQYVYLKTKTGQCDLYCREVPIVTEGEYTPPVSKATVLAYLVSPDLKKLCEKVNENILCIGEDLEEAPMSWGTEIRYKCKNRIVGGLTVRRTFFYIWWRINEKEWNEIKLQTTHEWVSKKNLILKKLITRYKALGGKN